jgi:hypothetical protein
MSSPATLLYLPYLLPVPFPFLSLVINLATTTTQHVLESPISIPVVPPHRVALPTFQVVHGTDLSLLKHP